MQLGGVALAAVGVLLVASERAREGDIIGAAALPNEPASSPPRSSRPGPPTGPPRHEPRKAIALALGAAVAMGLVLLGYNATARYDPLWAMLGGPLLVRDRVLRRLSRPRPRLEMRRSALPFVIAVGLLDTGANGLFALATTQGYLSLVSVLGSIYPVVTVLLAFTVLRERIAPHQMLGAAGTLAGIALIAAG